VKRQRDRSPDQTLEPFLDSESLPEAEPSVITSFKPVGNRETLADPEDTHDKALVLDLETLTSPGVTVHAQ